MICPTCNTQMNHLNQGGGHSSTDSYQTFDYVECPQCKAKAIEFYHTEFLTDTTLRPEFHLKGSPELETKIIGHCDSCTSVNCESYDGEKCTQCCPF